MDFESVTVNNCYILRDEVFSNFFFSNIEAKAVYSASIFHLAFFKKNISDISQSILENYQKLSIDLYRLNSSYLNIPFEINFHEKKLYQAYYESDHFPLSFWFEEKSLIPFNIFLRILEDVLYALKDLGKSGHSHLFLTPEEILIPLQWDNERRVKLNNTGINSLVSTLMTDKEILEYRSIYHKKGEKPVEVELINNISDDLYSLGTIMTQLLLICDSSIGDNKNNIQNKLDQFIDRQNSFTTIEDAISLFQDFFVIDDKSHILPVNPVSINYSGRATFDIPEFNDWNVEAELEPLFEEINHDEDNIIEPLIKKRSIYSSVASFISRLFSRKLKTTSKTLQDFSNIILTKQKEALDNNIINYTNNQSSNITGNLGNRIDTDNRNNIIDQINNHYIVQNVTNNDEENISTSFPVKSDKMEKIISKENIISHEDINYTIRDYSELDEEISKTSSKIAYRDSSSYKKNINNGTSKENKIQISQDKLNIKTHFTTALALGDYQKSYDIIKKTIDLRHKTATTKDLSDILDNKLKELDNHYIPNNSTDIFLKLEKFKEKQIILQTNFDEIKLSNDITGLEKPKTKKGVNFFLKIIIFFKKQYEKLISKK